MTTFLVDGSNVARSEAWSAVMRREQGELPHEPHRHEIDPRARLLDWIAHWRTRSGDDVVVIFDGEGPLGGGRRQWDHGYLVVASGAEDGDAVVESEAARLGTGPTGFRLVTNDHALANVAGANAEAVLSCETFVADLVADPVDEPGERSSGEFGSIVGGPSGAGMARVADDLDDEVRAKLERMRRGLDP